MKPSVIRSGPFDLQLCVPQGFTDEEVISFAENENPCGTKLGWIILRKGSEYLIGHSERVQCNDYNENVHIRVEA